MNTDIATPLIPRHGLKLKGRELQNYITAEVKRMRAGKKDYHLKLPAGWQKSECTIHDITVEEFRTTSRSDLVLLQKWLHAVPNTVLADAAAGELMGDSVLDTFDLAMMKRMLLS